MNTTYTRTTNKPTEEVKNEIERLAKERGFEIKEHDTLSGDKGYLLHICKQEWIDKILSKYPQVVSLLPCNILVRKVESETEVSIGNPTLIRAGGHMHDIEELIPTIEKELTSLVNDGAGVKPLKPTAIKLYATSTCPYCKKEKEYLESKGIEFEYILVDQNHEKAKEMVEKTGQMGVPVTEIDYEDANPEFIIGFDKPRLDTILEIQE